MPAANFAVTSFLGGEWSKSVQGRFDRPDYRTALDTCLNWIPLEQGALTRRPGTRHVCVTLAGTVARVIPFTFAQSAPYVMELTNQRLRFITSSTPLVGVTGPRLAVQAPGANVVHISTTNPAVMTIDIDRGWNPAVETVIYNLGTICPTLQGRTITLTRITGTTYSMTDGTLGGGIDGSTLGWVDGTPAAVYEVLDYTTDFTTSILPSLRCVQTEKVALMLTGTLAPHSIVLSTPPTTSVDATFLLGIPNLLDGPYLDPIPGSSMTYSATTGSVTFDTTGASWPGFVATDVGRLIRLFCEPNGWLGAATYATVGTLVQWNGSYWIQTGTVGGGNAGVPGGSANWSLTTNVAIWTWAKITAVNSPTEVVATIEGPNIPTTTAPGSFVINTWRLGVYSDTTGWPTCGTYHEGRVWLSGVIDNRIDSSVSGGVATDGASINMAPTDQYGNVLDSSAISYVFNAPDSNPLYWMSTDAIGIVCGTLAGEWLIQATTQNPALTPTNIKASRVTHNGCANIEPRRSGLTLQVVHRYTRKILEYFADVFSGRIVAQMTNYTWKHLTKGRIAELAYQDELAPMIWARMADGSFAGCTYKRESMMSSQEPNFRGGHRHVLGSGRIVTSICAGPSADGTRDALTMVTLDSATGLYHIEMLTDLWEEGNSILSAFYVDDGIVPTSYSADVFGQTITVNGLWHHNGKTVSAYVGGLDAGDYTVANGSITVPIDGSKNTLLTVDYIRPLLSGGLQIKVGFTFTSQARIVRTAEQKGSGAALGPALGNTTRAQEFAAFIYDTPAGAVSFGTSFARKLRPLAPKSYNGATLSTLPASQLYTGVYWDTLEGASDYDDNAWCAQVTRPLSANIAAVNVFHHTQDRG